MDGVGAGGQKGRVWTEDDYMQGRMPPEREQLERAPVAPPELELVDVRPRSGAVQQDAPAASLGVSSAFATGPNADLNNLRAAELGHFVLEVLDEPEKLYVHAPEGVRQILISYLDKNQLVSILRNHEVRDLLKLSAENFRFLQTVLSNYQSSLNRLNVAQDDETVAAGLLAAWEETHRPTLQSFSIMRQHNAQLSPAEFASAHKDSIRFSKEWKTLSVMMAAVWAGTGASYHKLQSLNPYHPLQSGVGDAGKWATGAFYGCTVVGALLSLFLIIQFCATLSARVREGRQDMSVALSKNAEKAATRVNTAQSRVGDMEGIVVQELERVGGPADGPRLEEIIEFPPQRGDA